ncbi:hypothetical protein CTI12_AA452140 [Artemisia annua]|uniref:Uncharacterized protein n=1 Tax=Artemisia annua TaxID=35608 RepID=A0A2U1LWD9_ARTAN|nr:hypothetical protein CTI12_AA452140 [Artemisia annua]
MVVGEDMNVLLLTYYGSLSFTGSLFKNTFAIIVGGILVVIDSGCHASTSAVPTKSGNGSLWDQFAKTHNLSTQKESSSLSLAGSSDDEVWMPEVMPGAGFLDELKSYDGYDYDFPAHGFESRPKGRHKY